MTTVGSENPQRMATPTPAPEVPAGLVELLLEGPACRPAAIEAGRRRAAGGPVDADRIAAAVVAEGPPLLELS